MRGLAILLVVLYHANAFSQYARGEHALFVCMRAGWCGVDLFFVLSGFLITGILLAARRSPHYYRSFYARRLLRIFPLYYGFLLLLFTLASHLPGVAPDESRRLLQNQAWYWSYLTNVRIALSQAWSDTPLRTGHLWSLAVEEQFYLVWPMLVRLCSERALGFICLGCLVTAPSLRLILHVFGVDPLAAYVLSPTRMDPLAVGALIAIVAGQPGGLQRVQRWIPAALVGALFTLAVPLWRYGRLSQTDPLMQAFGYSALAIGFGALLVAALASGAGSWLRRVLTARPLVACGRFSYAMYIFNDPLNLVLERAGLGVADLAGLSGSRLAGQALFLAISLTLCFCVAFVSWNAFEKRILAARRFFPYQ